MKNAFTASFFVASLVLAGCSNSGSGIAGDQVIASNCPSGGCADQTQDQSQLSITGPGQSTMYVASPKLSPQLQNASGVGGAFADQIQFGGDCYTSTYVSNQIQITLTVNGVPQTINPALGTGATSTRGFDGTIACRQGQYGFAIDGRLFPAGSSGQLNVSIIGVDANGGQYKNAAGGQYSVTIYRNN